MRPNRSGCPADGKLRSAGGPCPLNRLENRDCRSSKTRQMGPLSQQGCQLTRRRQRRNWRVRAVERGQRSERAWLRTHPGLHYFEPEKLARTQMLRNVWDRGAAGTGDGVNENGGIKLAFWTVAQFPPDKLRFTANRIYLKTQGKRAMHLVIPGRSSKTHPGDRAKLQPSCRPSVPGGQ
jgi:hypothetical protein